MKTFLKYLLAFFLSSLLGVVVSDLWLIWVWLPGNTTDVGLSIIAIAPILLIIFSLLGAVAGGVLGTILFFIKRRFFK